MKIFFFNNFCKIYYLHFTFRCRIDLPAVCHIESPYYVCVCSWALFSTIGLLALLAPRSCLNCCSIIVSPDFKDSKSSHFVLQDSLGYSWVFAFPYKF